MDKIVLEINSNEFIGLLNNYLSNKYGKKINVQTKSEFIPGDRPWESDYYHTEFYYQEEIPILNYKAKGTTYISDEEIKSIIRELIKVDGYEIINISINTRREYHECYLSDWYETEFKGVTIDLKSREKKLKLVY